MVCLNGRLLPEQEASFSIHDRGFLMGDGVYETFAVYDGEPFLLREHLVRLRASAERLRLVVPYADDEIVSWAGTIARRNKPRGRTGGRITLTRGPGEPHLRPSDLVRPTFLITAGHRRPPDPSRYQEGVEVVVSKIRRMPRQSLDPVIKSTNLLNSLLARFEAQERGAFDSIFLNMEGAVAEAAFSNLFVIDEGKRLLTPPLAEGILGGITRDMVLGIGRVLGLPGEERKILPEELLGSREVFLTASVMEIMPVVRVEGKAIGTGAVGEGTRALLGAYRRRVTAATGYEYPRGGGF